MHYIRYSHAVPGGVADHNDVTTNSDSPRVVYSAIDGRRGRARRSYDRVVVPQRKCEVGWDGRDPCSSRTARVPTSCTKIFWPDMRSGLLSERTVCGEADEPGTSTAHRIQQSDDVPSHQTLTWWSLLCLDLKTALEAHQTDAIQHGRIPSTYSS